MELYIQTQPDQTVALMTGNGQVLSIFSSIDNALYTCRDFYELAEIRVVYSTPQSQDLSCSTLAVA